MLHINIKIYGLVQGVFFRVSAKKLADSLNLKGFARNENDGSVYIELEGEKKKVEQFIKWCKKGPLLAEVEKLEITKGPVKKISEFLAI